MRNIQGLACSEVGYENECYCLYKILISGMNTFSYDSKIRNSWRSMNAKPVFVRFSWF